MIIERTMSDKWRPKIEAREDSLTGIVLRRARERHLDLNASVKAYFVGGDRNPLPADRLSPPGDNQSPPLTPAPAATTQL